MFDCDIMACRETDRLIHKLLGKVGDPPSYSTNGRTAKVLAKELGITVIPMNEPNHTHFFTAWGILPEEPPIGFLGFFEVEPTDEGDDLLLMHGWCRLSEAETFPLTVCRSFLVKAEVVVPNRVALPPLGPPMEA